MRLITWNEKNNPDLSADQVEYDCMRMAREFKNGATILGLQEIGEVEDLNSVEKAFKGWRIIGRRATPIILNPRFFRVIASGYVKTHDGKRDISPDRGFEWVQIKRVNRPWIKPFIVINTHYVSGAFKPGIWDAEWRREMWNRHHSILNTFVKAHVQGGLDVYIIGDMNRVHYSLNMPYVELASHGLDHILMVPATKKIPKPVDSRVFRDYLFTDHNPVIAEFTLVRH